MSFSGQIRSLAVRYSPGTRLENHSHDWDQLLFAAEGVMTVSTVDGRWVVPTQRAVWIPADIDHQVDCTGWVDLRTLYLVPGLREGFPTRCSVVSVDGLLRELILRVVAVGVPTAQSRAHLHLLQCLLDQVEAIETMPLELPMPADDRARRAAEMLRESEAVSPSLDELARKVGMSRRSLERCFIAETGLTLGRWRQQARLLQALTLLAGNVPVTRVASEVGYSNPSAFIAAFRRAFGTSPAKFFVRPKFPSARSQTN